MPSDEFAIDVKPPRTYSLHHLGVAVASLFAVILSPSVLTMSFQRSPNGAVSRSTVVLCATAGLPSLGLLCNVVCSIPMYLAADAILGLCAVLPSCPSRLGVVLKLVILTVAGNVGRC